MRQPGGEEDAQERHTQGGQPSEADGGAHGRGVNPNPPKEGLGDSP